MMRGRGFATQSERPVFHLDSHRRPSISGLAVILACFGLAVLASAVPAVGEHPAALSSIAKIRQLKAGKHDAVDVHIRAVVTYYDTVAPNLFVLDQGEGIWVDLRGSVAKPPVAGDVLDLHKQKKNRNSPNKARPQRTVVG